MRMTAGIIGPAHGLRGEVLVDVRSDDPELWAPGSLFSLEDSPLAELTISGARIHKERLLVSFEEITSREKAEELRGARLLVEEHEEEDAWYPHQLKGLKALTPKGEELGTVSGIRFGSAQDLLLVRTPEATVMVPFVAQIVPKVDLESGVVTIDAPPGLFDDDVVDTGETRAQR